MNLSVKISKESIDLILTTNTRSSYKENNKMISSEESMIEVLISKLRDSAGKKCRITLKNGFSYVTSDILLKGNFISFHDLKDNDVCMDISAISYVEVLG